MLKAFAPLVVRRFAAMVAPVNTPGPKSTAVVNRPLVTLTLLLVTGPAKGTPVRLVLYSVNARLYTLAWLLLS